MRTFTPGDGAYMSALLHLTWSIRLGPPIASLPFEFFLRAIDELSCPAHGEVSVGRTHKSRPVVGCVLQAEEALQAHREVSSVRGGSLEEFSGASMVVPAVVTSEAGATDSVRGGNPGKYCEPRGDIGKALSAFVRDQLGRFKIGAGHVQASGRFRRSST